MKYFINATPKTVTMAIIDKRTRNVLQLIHGVDKADCIFEAGYSYGYFEDGYFEFSFVIDRT